MDAIWKTALAIIGSIGGAGAIICAVVKYASDRIAGRLEAKYQSKLSKELETHKSQLEKHNYISRAMFEKEFAIYNDLSDRYFNAYRHIEILHGIQKTGKKVVKLSELPMDSPSLLSLFEKYKKEGIITEQQVKAELTNMTTLLLEYRSALFKCGAFIPHDIQRLFIDIYDTTYLLFYGEDATKTTFNDLLAAIGKMQIELRKYLHSITIID